MERSDYLLRQIQLMMQTLVSLIRRLTGLKDFNDEILVSQETDKMLSEHLNTTLDEIQQTPVNEVVDFIVIQKGVHISNIDLLAEVLVLNANAKYDPAVKAELLLRALKLLEWSDKTSGTYSIDRHEKIERIKTILKGED
jgi:hypothetical protein